MSDEADAGDGAEVDPTVEDDPGPKRDRTLTWWPFAGAIVVAAIVVLVIVVSGPGRDDHTGAETDSSGALVCPATYQQPRPGNAKAWVPADASGVDGGKHLVPDAAPSHVTLCEYGTSDVARAKQIRLTGHRTLREGLREATADLSHAPRTHAAQVASGCASREDDYLLGLRFHTGFVWVSVPGYECFRTSNGDFVTSASFGAPVRTAFRDRAWPAR